MRPSYRRWLAISAAGVAACGCDAGSNGPTPIDISGMYQVSHHTVSANDCVNEGTVLTTLPYFRVSPGTKGYTAVRCTGADVSTCANDLTAAAFSGDLIVVVDQAASDGWTGTLASGSTMSGCMLLYATSSALLVNGDLRIEDRRYVDRPTLDAAACTAAEAEKRAASMPCDGFNVYVGAKQ
jgi:hypothetical protein